MLCRCSLRAVAFIIVRFLWSAISPTLASHMRSSQALLFRPPPPSYLVLPRLNPPAPTTRLPCAFPPYRAYPPIGALSVRPLHSRRAGIRANGADKSAKKPPCFSKIDPCRLPQEHRDQAGSIGGTKTNHGPRGGDINGTSATAYFDRKQCP